jgi:hypothetical protein
MRGHAGVDDSLRDARELVERCAGSVSAIDDRARVERARRARGEDPFS